MISKGGKVAAMVQLADMTMCALNHSAQETIHNGASTPLYATPPTLNSHSPVELFCNFSVEPYAGDSSTTSSIVGEYPDFGLETAECVTACNQTATPSCIDVQQPNAACISTEIKVRHMGERTNQ